MRSRLATIIVVTIVALTFVIGLIVGAQRDDKTGPVDLIVYNGKVYPADGSGTSAEALAVRGNKILRVGSNRDIKRLAGRATRMIDAHGGSVLPGFDDAHAHLVGGGLGLQQANLLSATTLAEIGAVIRAFAATHPNRPWVLGRGWYYTPFPGGLPTRQQLDSLVPDRPAYIRCYDGHTAWVNTLALQAAGITRQTPDPPGGLVVRDAAGEPTGVLKEAAQELVAKVVPRWTRADRLQAIREAIGEAHRLGVTSVQNAGVDVEELELYGELVRKGELGLRLYNAISLEPPFSEAEADRLDALWKSHPDDALVKTGAVKLMLDGVIESRTAAMLAPYANGGGSGLPEMDPETLDAVVAMMDRRGWQVMVHAIGDAAVRWSLDAFERAAAVNPPPARGRRHRIEHVETIDPSDVPRFGRLGVIAVQQPFHGNPNPLQLDVWRANLGPERASRGWAQRSILDAGGRLAMGSDWPVVTLDPRFQINMAINRTTPEGAPAGGWLPEQRLPLSAAIDAYTSGAAYASFDEQRKGQLAPGMLADIVILSTDVFAAPPERFVDANVEVTIFDGRVVYGRVKP